MKYTFRSMTDDKLHFTRAPFVGWHGPDGPLGVYYAIFARRSDTLFVPKYLLTKETLAALPSLPQGETGEQARVVQG